MSDVVEVTDSGDGEEASPVPRKVRSCFQKDI